MLFLQSVICLFSAAHTYNSTLEYRHDLVKRQITLCKNNIQ